MHDLKHAADQQRRANKGGAGQGEPDDVVLGKNAEQDHQDAEGDEPTPAGARPPICRHTGGRHRITHLDVLRSFFTFRVRRLENTPRPPMSRERIPPGARPITDGAGSDGPPKFVRSCFSWRAAVQSTHESKFGYLCADRAFPGIRRCDMRRRNPRGLRRWMFDAVNQSGEVRMVDSRRLDRAQECLKG
jgi:hypothetical protein